MAAIGFATSFLLVFTFLSLLSSSSATGLGFSVDLIHRDSPSSPFYNLSLTPYEHLANGLRRSHERADHFVSVFKNEQYPSSDLIPTSGAYLMKIALGTPPFTIFAIADTGSILTWTQCAPCTQCYKQKAPLFDPKKSLTYKPFSCKSDTCFDYGSSCTSNGTCQYYESYGGGQSYSKGIVASETLTLGAKSGGPLSFPRITFGCGYESAGTFNENISGIVGLGGMFPSLITQLNSSIQGKFSYCLGPSFSEMKTSSKINFGTNAVVAGGGVVSTPIVERAGFFFLTLEALYVGEHRVNVSNPSSTSSDNIFIDSGTTLTYLVPSVYKKFESLVKKAMGNKTVPDPLKELNLCYRLSDKPLFPTISAQFTGARIDLKPINTFVETGDDITCLAFSTRRIPIYGNIAQTNFLVGYDTVKQSLSFKPSNCGEAWPLVSTVRLIIGLCRDRFIVAQMLPDRPWHCRDMIFEFMKMVLSHEMFQKMMHLSYCTLENRVKAALVEELIASEI